jgi:hypothetical protein
MIRIERAIPRSNAIVADEILKTDRERSCFLFLLQQELTTTVDVFASAPVSISELVTA